MYAVPSVHRLLCAALISCVLVLVPASEAAASHTQVSILQDDLHLVYTSPPQATQTLQTLASLGVDWVKVSMIWGIVAPDAGSAHRPAFNATDPAAYSPAVWDRYDLIVRTAQSLGLKVYFQFAPPTPRWAFDRRFPARIGRRLGHAPAPSELEQFVTAVGRRYSGTYAGLPRVGVWGIWNEPNYPAWLQPTRRSLGHGRVEKTQPSLYRGIVNATWGGLQASGHGGDTILLGETANPGNETPLEFIRDVYCVSASGRQLSGASAVRVGCPSSRTPRARFVADNPGLFAASGWAHHPYGFDVAPNRRYHVSSFVTLENIGALHRTLNRILGSYRARPRGGIPVYVSEWGYRTNPPNPFYKTTLGEQQAWLDQGDYMMWRHSYVQSIAQFLLFDGPPLTRYPTGSRKRYFNFDTGLEFSGGGQKPSFASYRLPVWLPSQRHGRHVTVWGQLRTANHAALQSAAIEFRRSAHAGWSTIAHVQTTNPEGFFLTHTAIGAAGFLRVGATDARSGATDYSRTVRIG